MLLRSSKSERNRRSGVNGDAVCWLWWLRDCDAGRAKRAILRVGLKIGECKVEDEIDKRFGSLLRARADCISFCF